MKTLTVWITLFSLLFSGSSAFSQDIPKIEEIIAQVKEMDATSGRYNSLTFEAKDTKITIEWDASYMNDVPPIVRYTSTINEGGVLVKKEATFSEDATIEHFEEIGRIYDSKYEAARANFQASGQAFEISANTSHDLGQTRRVSGEVRLVGQSLYIRELTVFAEKINSTLPGTTTVNSYQSSPDSVTDTLVQPNKTGQFVIKFRTGKLEISALDVFGAAKLVFSPKGLTNIRHKQILDTKIKALVAPEQGCRAALIGN